MFSVLLAVEECQIFVKLVKILVPLQVPFEQCWACFPSHAAFWERAVGCEQNCQLWQIRNQLQPSTNDREISEHPQQGRHKEREFWAVSTRACVCVECMHPSSEEHCPKWVFALLKRFKIPDTEHKNILCVPGNKSILATAEKSVACI